MPALKSDDLPSGRVPDLLDRPALDARSLRNRCKE